jgi:hypothetical protein
MDENAPRTLKYTMRVRVGGIRNYNLRLSVLILIQVHKSEVMTDSAASAA